ncbi:MAG: carbon-nitrogen hydrolase family protein, partial [Armatimonadota bacterium]|nr:carbon-nitrogen hydrolase family protein [Armatimonadota bacterium]
MTFPSGPAGFVPVGANTAVGWTTWAPRAEIAPQFRVEAGAGGDALVIHGSGNPACHGAWRRRVAVTNGRQYRFTARYRVHDIPYACRNVTARLDWRDANGERIRQPDHAREAGTEDGWTTLKYNVTAPEGACAVVLELSLAWSASGTVWWDEVALTEEASRPERLVRVATLHHRPRNTNSAAGSVAQFCRLAESAAPHKPDLICLPEAISFIGTGKELHETGESVPGPTTEALGAVAKSLNCYLVAGLFERVGPVVYNTAVLIGRAGEIVGTYRKTHLPREEVEAGLTPGDSYQVFQTDFGTVGILICWDAQFPEPARAMALRGAEILLLPIWGGNELLVRARAIENHVFLVASSYDLRSYILDPAGNVLAEATDADPIVVAELALD